MMASVQSAAIIPKLGLVTRDSVKRELARRDPSHFGQWLDSRFTRPRHLAYIGKRLGAALEAGGARIIVCAPPRHGKSALTSHRLPAWYLWRWPFKRVILCGYGGDFASTWGEKVRDLIVENYDKLGLRILRGDKAAMDEWVTEEGGGMKTAGVGTGILGRGADLFIVDDPTKDPEEAWSPTYQEKLRNWWQGAASSRLEPGASVIITMQRWPGHDFVSFLTARSTEGREPWEIISLPAVAEADDPLGRQIGEALWPERYDEVALEEKRLGLEDQSYWLGQWQQRPPETGREGLAYGSFDAMKNVEHVEYDPKLPLIWSLDFNWDPMCSVIAQVQRDFTPATRDWLRATQTEEVVKKNIRILDEICMPNSSTQKVTDEFISRAQVLMEKHNQNRIEVIIHGDASGHSHKTTSEADYRVIEEKLRTARCFTFSVRAPKANGSVRERVITTNNAFLNAAGERRMRIDPQCRELRADLLYMRWKRDVAGNTLNELDKSNPFRSHVSDALGYLCEGELKMQAKAGFRSARLF